MKTATSSIEYRHLVRELQVLADGRINKIYQDGDFFAWQTYTGTDRPNLIIDIPNTVYLTQTKFSFPKPGGFCMFLRKRLQGGRIKAVEQMGFDRIIRFTIETKQQTYRLYVELFGKGNLLVCDEEDEIISLLHNITYSDRALRGGETYQLPEPQPDVTKMSVEELEKYFGEESAVIVLASKLGLGGEYAEYILREAEIDKETKKPDIKKIHAQIQNVLEESSPQYTEDAAYPIHFSEEGTSTKTFSQAIAAIRDDKRKHAKAQEKTKEVKKRADKHERILQSQEKHIKGFKKSREVNMEKGELLYLHYQELKDLFMQARKDRKELGEEAFKKKYEAHPLIEKADKQQLTVQLGEDDG